MGNASEDRQIPFYIFTWVLGGLFTVLKGVWVGPGISRCLDFSFLAILTAYLFLIYGSTAAGGFALGQGLLIDIFSSGYNGLFTSVYFGVFGAIYVASIFFNVQEIKGQMIIVSFSVFIKFLLLFFMLMLFSQQAILSPAYLEIAGGSIALSGLIAPLLFRLLDPLRSIFRKEDNRSSSETF